MGGEQRDAPAGNLRCLAVPPMDASALSPPHLGGACGLPYPIPSCPPSPPLLLPQGMGPSYIPQEPHDSLGFPGARRERLIDLIVMERQQVAAKRRAAAAQAATAAPAGGSS